jgi:hypothetical protein
VRLVVADTSPLHYLVLTGDIELLAQLFGRVLVPQTVRGYREPRQVLLTEYMPCGLKFGRAIKCTDVEMRFSRQASAFAGQC